MQSHCLPKWCFVSSAVVAVIISTSDWVQSYHNNAVYGCLSKCCTENNTHTQTYAWYIQVCVHSQKVEPLVNWLTLEAKRQRSQQISGLLTQANGQQRCVFSLDLLMQRMCDVTEKLVLLYHCGRISNTCRDLTSALPLLSCFCTWLNSPSFFFFLLFVFSFQRLDATRPQLLLSCSCVNSQCLCGSPWTVSCFFLLC